MTARLYIIVCSYATVRNAFYIFRLGIIQGGSHTFIAPIVAMMALDKWQCHNTGGMYYRRLTFVTGWDSVGGSASSPDKMFSRHAALAQH